MPIYEYKCQSCGKVFERIQKFADSPLTTHDDCGGTVDRLVSAPAFHLKGSGWYVTDYAKGGSGGPIKPADTSSSAASDSKGSDSKAESKSETKSETKAESKTESKPAASESKPASSSSSSDSK